jgi:hypothetical protein
MQEVLVIFHDYPQGNLGVRVQGLGFRFVISDDDYPQVEGLGFRYVGS